jgi:hypothetical protein
VAGATPIAIALVRGRWRSLHPLLLIVAAAFAWYFVDGIDPS